MDEKPKVRTKEQKAKRKNRRWVVFITILTFFLAFAINLISEVMIQNAVTGVAMVILLVIVLIGILFDIIGIAVTAANEAPFHSMASRKVPGASHSIGLIKSAERVSNVCNDVVGDIVGIISGATAAVIVARLCAGNAGLDEFWTGLAFTALVAAVTVGGKGAGKSFAVKQSADIVAFVGKVLYYLDLKRLGKKLGGKKNGTSAKK